MVQYPEKFAMGMLLLALASDPGGEGLTSLFIDYVLLACGAWFVSSSFKNRFFNRTKTEPRDEPSPL